MVVAVLAPGDDTAARPSPLGFRRQSGAGSGGLLGSQAFDHNRAAAAAGVPWQRITEGMVVSRINGRELLGEPASLVHRVLRAAPRPLRLTFRLPLLHELQRRHAALAGRLLTSRLQLAGERAAAEQQRLSDDEELSALEAKLEALTSAVRSLVALVRWERGRGDRAAAALQAERDFVQRLRSGAYRVLGAKFEAVYRAQRAAGGAGGAAVGRGPVSPGRKTLQGHARALMLARRQARLGAGGGGAKAGAGAGAANAATEDDGKQAGAGKPAAAPEVAAASGPVPAAAPPAARRAPGLASISKLASMLGRQESDVRRSIDSAAATGGRGGRVFATEESERRAETRAIEEAEARRRGAEAALQRERMRSSGLEADAAKLRSKVLRLRRAVGADGSVSSEEEDDGDDGDGAGAGGPSPQARVSAASSPAAGATSPLAAVTPPQVPSGEAAARRRASTTGRALEGAAAAFRRRGARSPAARDDDGDGDGGGVPSSVSGALLREAMQRYRRSARAHVATERLLGRSRREVEAARADAEAARREAEALRAQLLRLQSGGGCGAPAALSELQRRQLVAERRRAVRERARDARARRAADVVAPSRTTFGLGPPPPKAARTRWGGRVGGPAARGRDDGAAVSMGEVPEGAGGEDGDEDDGSRTRGEGSRDSAPGAGSGDGGDGGDGPPAASAAATADDALLLQTPDEVCQRMEAGTTAFFGEAAEHVLQASMDKSSREDSLQGPRKWQRRYVTLGGRLLRYFRQSADTVARRDVRLEELRGVAALPLAPRRGAAPAMTGRQVLASSATTGGAHGLSADDIDREAALFLPRQYREHVMWLRAADKSYYFAFGSAEERAEWVLTFRAVLVVLRDSRDTIGGRSGAVA